MSQIVGGNRRDPLWNLSQESVGAILAGLAMVAVGVYALAALWFEDLS